MATSTTARQPTLFHGALIARDMVPVTPTETFAESVLYIGTGGTLVFTVPNPQYGVVNGQPATLTRTVTCPDGFVTPFFVTNVQSASTAADIHRMVF